MAQSFAYDQDLEYTQEDLQRVYEEGWHAGPQGVFLTKTERGKIYYSKSFVYALFLAPFITIFGFQGFLILNMLMLLVMIWMGWIYLRQFNASNISMLVSLTFFLLSASFIYTFWITPETFNMFCITLGLFLWLYKREARAIQRTSESHLHLPQKSLAVLFLTAPFRFLQWLLTTAQGRLYLAPIPIGIACVSKLPNALFILPMIADVLLESYRLIFRKPQTRSSGSSRLPVHWHSRTVWQCFRRLVLLALVFWLLVGLFYGLQHLLTGHFNPYAGDRKTFYWTFPFVSLNDVWERGIRLSNDDYFQQSFFFHPKTLLYNAYYYLFGRFTGMLPYFFCAFLALYYFVKTLFFRAGTAAAFRRDAAKGGETLRRILLLLTIAASIGAYIVMAPSNYQGGGGAFGNRFFLNIYPAFLFLITGISSIRPLVVSWIVGSLFLAQTLISPFQSSYYPAYQAFRLPYRLLPVELTLIDTLPTNVNHHLMRMMHEVDPPFRLYFVDEYAADISSRGFWVQGKRTAEMVVRTYEPQDHLVVAVTNGPIGNQVDVTVAGQTQSIRFQAPRETKQLVFPLQWSMPYFDSSLYPVKIRSHTGYVPRFTAGTASNDQRFLGCRVRLSLNPLDIGQAYLANDQPGEASAILEALVKKQPENIQARYYLALAYQQTGKLEAAAQELEHCNHLLPNFRQTILQQCETQGTTCTSELVKTDPHPQDMQEHIADFLQPITRRYEAEQLSRKTGNISRQDAASNGKVVVFDPAKNPPEYLVYGQYATYPPGLYQARFRIQSQKSYDDRAQPLGTAFFIEVYNKDLGILEREGIFLENRQKTQPAEFREYTLNFDLAYSATLEFRVETTGYARVAVDKIDVYPRLPQQIYRAVAQVKLSNGAYDDALSDLEQLLIIDPWSPSLQIDALKAELDAQKWENALEIITKHQDLSNMRTGIASVVVDAEQIVNPRLRDYLERLYAHFVPQIPCEHIFDQTLALIGYDLAPTTTTAGDRFRIQYFWKALRPVDEDYTVFVHFKRKGDTFCL